MISLATPVAAQSPTSLTSPTEDRRFAVGLVAGASQFDLSGTGTTAIVGARFETRLRRWLLAEAALSTFRPEEQSDPRVRYTVPELQLQLQAPGRLVRPYLGVGGGWVLASDDRPSRGTMSGAGGVRVPLAGARVALRAELRVRGIGRNFSGSTAEWLGGLAYHF